MRKTPAALLGFFCVWLPLHGANGAENVRYGTASYYTVSSVISEGTCTDPARRRCLMANGKELRDEAKTAASWDYPFGTALNVCQAARGDHGPCVQIVVTDRGPSRALYKKGRILDLSQKSFEALADLKEGVIEVEITTP